MILRGYIYDNISKAPIPSASVVIVNQAGTYSGIGTQTDQNGYFFINTNDFSYGYYLQVSSVGYQTVRDELYDEYAFNWTGKVFLNRQTVNLPPVVVTTGPKKNSWAWLLLGLPLLDQKNIRTERAKVGAINTGTIVAIGAGFLLLKGMGLVNSLFDALGLGNSGATAAATDPASCWHPGYWRGHASAPLYVIFGTSYQNFDNISADLYNSFGVLQDDWNKVFASFQKLRSKSEVSFLAERFEGRYNEALLSFLQNGGGLAPWDGLSDSHMKILINYVDNLPATT